MHETTLGICMHSGWGILVAVSGDPPSIAIVERRRFEIIDPAISGAKQPYHHAATLALTEAEKYLRQCAAVSERLAAALIDEVVQQQTDRGHRIVGAAILRSAARPLPALSSILASHPLIHTAEGEFFRDVVAKACEESGIPVRSIKERELEERANTVFGAAVNRVQQAIAKLGATIGPPWTKDHKIATLAASLVLPREKNTTSTYSRRKIG